MPSTFQNLPGFGGIVEILVLAWFYYMVITFFRGTRSAQVLTGLVVLIVALILLTWWLNLEQLNWLLGRLTLYLAVALFIIFQPEIRRALAELGRQPVLQQQSDSKQLVNHVVEAVILLADQKIGALIAIEGDIGTRAIQETGTPLDSEVTPELLAAIFFPHTPLHDGGVIIRDGRIVAAGCLFPLTQRSDLAKGLGTRHRAAMGLTEETDAVVVVVSEETGTISVSWKGRLSRDFDRERLVRFLRAVLGKGINRETRWRKARRELDRTSSSRDNEFVRNPESVTLKS